MIFTAAGNVTFDTAAGTTLEYFNGSSWVAYTASATVPSSGTLLVRLGITNDTPYEGAETFQLKVSSSTLSPCSLKAVTACWLNG